MSFIGRESFMSLPSTPFKCSQFLINIHHLYSENCKKVLVVNSHSFFYSASVKQTQVLEEKSSRLKHSSSWIQSRRPTEKRKLWSREPQLMQFQTVKEDSISLTCQLYKQQIWLIANSLWLTRTTVITSQYLQTFVDQKSSQII